MILSVRIENFRSFKEEQFFSMLPERKVKEHGEYIIHTQSIQSLSTAIFYGRNSAGKSNFLRAIRAVQYLVLESSELSVDDDIQPYEPYKLSTDTEKKPISISIEFVAKNNIKYIYSISFLAKEIISESLFFYPKKQAAKLFERKVGEEITYGEYLTGNKKGIESLLYKNQLFLSKAGKERLDQLIPVYLFFKDYMFYWGSNNTFREEQLSALYSQRMAKEDSVLLKNLNKLITAGDTAIASIEIKESGLQENHLPSEMTKDEKQQILDKYKYQIRTVHPVFDGEKETGTSLFDLSEESAGTRKLIVIGAIILEALADGQVLLIDELDNSLHPKLTRILIDLFHNSKTNPHKAQLIFATHDVSLLDSDLFRRDQVWFVEKEYKGNSHFYSLSDIPEVRKDTPFEKWYMKGRFGAISIINSNDLNFIF